MPKTPYVIPCADDCPVKSDLEGIFSKIDENALDPRILCIIHKSVENFPKFSDSKARNLGFSALFDFCVNLGYIYGLQKEQEFRGGVYCENKVVFPFVKICPVCSAQKKEVVFLEKGSKKPESAVIGKIGEATLTGILDAYFNYLGNGFRAFLIRDTAEKKVDLVITDFKVVCLGEIKAKPLVSYPLCLELSELNEKKHQLVDVKSNDVTRSYLFIPHINEYFDLGKTTDNDWPFGAALKIVSDKKNVAKIITAWQQIFDEYAKTDDDAAFNWIRFLAFGGGAYKKNNIDDSKNRPGLDRTDDIKKGTYQVLRYGANYAIKCKEGNVKCVLVGNTYGETHRAYFEDIIKIRWTIDGTKTYNLFDAVIGLTDNRFNDEYLKKHLKM